MIPQPKQPLLREIDKLLFDGQQLLAPLGSNIWHGQTMLYDEEATKRVTAFIVRFCDIADQLGDNGKRWKHIVGAGGGHFDVNLMRQTLGALQGFKKIVDQRLPDSDASEENMDYDPKLLERLGTLIAEGRAIEAAIVATPGEVKRAWVNGKPYQSSTRYDLDWPRFSKWCTDAATVLDLAIPNRHSLRDLVDSFRSMQAQKDSLEWGIAQLESVRESYQSGILRAAVLDNGEAVSAEGQKTVFIVHGHDMDRAEVVARLVEKRGLTATILHEQPNQGRTIIEKFEKHAAPCGFAVVILGPDDEGRLRGDTDAPKPRARQNVIMEMGYFLHALGRSGVAVLYSGGVELPSDINGLVYISLENNNWKTDLEREMKAAGLI